jgi:hypothetical protein
MSRVPKLVDEKEGKKPWMISDSDCPCDNTEGAMVRRLIK